MQLHGHLLLWDPETTSPLDVGSEYFISRWPQKAYLGTFLTKLPLLALPCPAINISSTLSGSLTGPIQPGGFDGTPGRGIGEQALIGVPQFHDSSAPYITSFTFKAVLERLAATRANLIPMSLVVQPTSLRGAPEDGQGSEHHTNLSLFQR